MWVVVPVKKLDLAKERLAPLLGVGQRRSLAVALLHDVLGAIAAAQRVSGILVVTGDAEVAAVARSLGASVCNEPPEHDQQPGPVSRGSESGLNRALGLAVQWLELRGVEALAVLPADLPLAEASEIDRLATAVAEAGSRPLVVVVPDRRRAGTNALVTKPLGVVPFAFGAGSAERHLQLAKERGVTALELDLPTLRLDIDTEQDLEELSARETGSHARAWLDSVRDRQSLLPAPSALGHSTNHVEPC